ETRRECKRDEPRVRRKRAPPVAPPSWNCAARTPVSLGVMWAAESPLGLSFLQIIQECQVYSGANKLVYRVLDNTRRLEVLDVEAIRSLMVKRPPLVVSHLLE